jgi:hypothetical protein
MEKIAQKFEEEISKLPVIHSQAIRSINWIETVEKISKDQGLDETETEDVVIETGLALLGLRDFETFSEKIEEIIVIEKKSTEVSEKIISQILYKVLDIVNPGTPENSQQVISNATVEKESGFLINNSKFSILPKEVQKAISLSGWQGSLLEIAKENKLNIEQSGILEDITIRAMANEISHEDYPKKLSSELNLDSEKASKIISSVGEKIFQKIRNIMRGEQKGVGYDSGLDSDEIPIPPYAKSFDLDKKTGENTLPSENQELIDGQNNKVKEILSDKTMPINMGGIKSVDIAIPKPLENTPSVKLTPNNVETINNHDPYREII